MVQPARAMDMTRQRTSISPSRGYKPAGSRALTARLGQNTFSLRSLLHLPTFINHRHWASRTPMTSVRHLLTSARDVTFSRTLLAAILDWGCDRDNLEQYRLLPSPVVCQNKTNNSITSAIYHASPNKSSHNHNLCGT